MSMYVNYYDLPIRLEVEEHAIGIIQCKDKNDTLVEINLPEGNTRIFFSKYKLVLPSKNEFKRIMKA